MATGADRSFDRSYRPRGTAVLAHEGSDADRLAGYTFQDGDFLVTFAKNDGPIVMTCAEFLAAYEPAVDVETGSALRTLETRLQAIERLPGVAGELAAAAADDGAPIAGLALVADDATGAGSPTP